MRPPRAVRRGAVVVCLLAAAGLAALGPAGPAAAVERADVPPRIPGVATFDPRIPEAPEVPGLIAGPPRPPAAAPNSSRRSRPPVSGPRVGAGVSIGGVDVSGLTPAAATRAVLRHEVAPRLRPLALAFRGQVVRLEPRAAGYRADVRGAVRAALRVKASRRPAGRVRITLRQSVDQRFVQAFLAGQARRLDVTPRAAGLRFQNREPVVTRPRVGLRLAVKPSTRVVVRALLERPRGNVRLRGTRVLPPRRPSPAVVLVERDRFRLSLFRDGRLETFPIAVGQTDFPTPVGDFRIASKQANPTWYPPDAPWAAGFGPIAPGTGNPLGTRWMGISVPGIGLHGTPVASSVGTAVSHGCVRMRIADAEFLFSRVRVGTRVHIR